MENSYAIYCINDGYLRFLGYTCREVKEVFNNKYINNTYEEDRDNIKELTDDALKHLIRLSHIIE